MTDHLRHQLQDTLGEAYVLERELGGGGMSRVFVAHDTALGRKVVVKVLPPELAAEVSYERFRREIQMAAQLQHPHIVPLLSAGETLGLPFFTMPFVDGESLRVRIDRSGELPIAQAVRILREVASALGHAHDRGIAHRDIKPDNVLLTGGSAVVTDFGVAKALSASQRPHDVGAAGVLTSHGIALGTPAYMAPEQAAADPASDHRVDVYAFGVLAYELLTGQPPFTGRLPQALLAAHVGEAPEPIVRRRGSIPPSLASLVMRCLEKRAADRPQSAAELVQLLDALGTPSGGLAPARRRPPFLTPPRLRAGLAAVATLLIAAAAMYGTYRSAGTAAADGNRLRVHVAPFVDRTLAPELAPLGPLAADLVTQGIAETGLVEVVQDSLAAGTLVRGTVYRQGDTLQLLAHVTDARSGRVLRSVGPLLASREDASLALEALRDQVAGGVAALLDPILGAIAPVTSAPPSFEAYREVREGREAEAELDHVRAISHYLRAAAVGEGYLFPLVAATEAYARIGECAAADSLGRHLLGRRDRLTPYEAYSVDETLAGCRGARDAAYRAAVRKMEIVPRSPIARYGVAQAALATGRSHEASRLLAALADDPAAGDLSARPDFGVIHARALHASGAYVQELALARRLRTAAPEVDDWLAIELRALAALGRHAEAGARLAGAAGGAWARAAEVVIDELRVHGHDDAARPLAERLVTWHLREGGATLDARGALLRAYYAAGRWGEARRLADSLVEIHPASASLLTLQGRIAARQGDRRAAARVGAALARMAPPDGPGSVPHPLARARIAALLGEREQAVALLELALAQGESMPLRIREEPDFAPLRGHGRFERLTGEWTAAGT